MPILDQRAFEIVREPKSGTHRLEGPKETVASLNRFLHGLDVRGASPHTIEAYAYDLLTLYAWLSETGRRLQKLNQSDLTEFIARERQRGQQPRSINRRLSTLRLVFQFVTGTEIEAGLNSTRTARHYRGPGRERDLGLHNLHKPTRVALRVKEPATLVEPLTPEQVWAFLATLRRYRDVAMIYLMLLCGLRSCEIIGARIGDLDLFDSRLRVRGKGNKERALPIPPLVKRAIRRYLELEHPDPVASNSLFVVLQGARRGQGMTRSGLRRIFRTRRMTALLANANAHRFRHTFGSDMARAGVRLPVLQKMMGHDHSATTLQYINLSMADIADAYNRAIEEIERRYDDQAGPKR